MADIKDQVPFDLYTPQRVLIFISIVVTYFIVSFASKGLLPFYPADTIAIAALLIFGKEFYPAIFTASFCTQIGSSTPLMENLSFSTANTSAALIAAIIISYVIKKSSCKQSSCKSYSELIAIFFGLGIASTIRALMAVLTVYHFEKISNGVFNQYFINWWAGSFITGIVFLPFLLEVKLIIKEKRMDDFVDVKKIIILIFLNIIAIASLRNVFLHDLNQAYAWFWCIVILFTGLYLGQIYARLTTLILSFAVVYLSFKDFGAFDFGIKNLNYFYINILIFSYGLSALVVGTINIEIRKNKKFIMAMTASWTILCGTIYVTSVKEQSVIRQDFNSIVDKTIESVHESMSDIEDLMRGASGLIIADPKVTNTEWKEYINIFDKSKTFSVVNGVGVIYPPSKPDSLNIFHYESHYETQIVPGIDLGFDSALLEGANQSRKQNRTFASETTQILHNKKLYNSFIVFHPINASPSFNKKFGGWIFAPIITEHFFNKAIESFKENIEINIIEKNKNIYSSHGNDNHTPRDIKLSTTTLTEIYGNPWIFNFYPREAFYKRHESLTVPISGLFISIYFLLVCFFVELFSFSTKADYLIKEKTKELEEGRTKMIQVSKINSLCEMAAGMAHEINNPLTIINGRLQIMMSKNPEPDIKVELEKMLANTEKISLIINNLREFSGRKDRTNLEFSSINKIINHAIALCAAAIKDNKVNIKLDLPNDFEVNCQPTQISQVIFYLINNSCDAISKLQEKWILIKSVKTAHNSIQIFVIDSGNGIPDEIADKLMQPFFTTKEIGVGKGIDLSTSLGIIREHHGSLILDRNAKNTTFVIELPV